MIILKKYNDVYEKIYDDEKYDDDCESKWLLLRLTYEKDFYTNALASISGVACVFFRLRKVVEGMAYSKYISSHIIIDLYIHIIINFDTHSSMFESSLLQQKIGTFSQIFIIEDVKSDLEVVSTRKVRNGTTLKDLRSTLHLWIQNGFSFCHKIVFTWKGVPLHIQYKHRN